MTEREFFKRGRGRGFENQGGCSIEIERRFKNASLNHEVAAPRIPRCTLDLTEFCVETSDRLNLRNGPPLDILKRGGFVPSALVFFFSLSLFRCERSDDVHLFCSFFSRTAFLSLLCISLSPLVQQQAIEEGRTPHPRWTPHTRKKTSRTGRTLRCSSSRPA